MQTYLTTSVFLDVLDSARVSAPWAQLVCHTNATGIWLLLRALHVTMLTEWQLRTGAGKVQDVRNRLHSKNVEPSFLRHPTI